MIQGPGEMYIGTNLSEWYAYTVCINGWIPEKEGKGDSSTCTMIIRAAGEQWEKNFVSG